MKKPLKPFHHLIVDFAFEEGKKRKMNEIEISLILRKIGQTADFVIIMNDALKAELSEKKRP